LYEPASIAWVVSAAEVRAGPGSAPARPVRVGDPVWP